MKGDAAVDVRGLKVMLRVMKVKKVAKTVGSGKIIEAIANGPRMTQLADKMAKKIRGLEAIGVDEIGTDCLGYFRRL